MALTEAEVSHLVAVVVGAAVLGVTVSVAGTLMTSRVVGAALVVGTAVLVVGAALQHPWERQHESDVCRAWPTLPLSKLCTKANRHQGCSHLSVQHCLT